MSSGVEGKGWEPLTPYVDTKSSASLWPPSRRASIATAVVVVLALVAGGAALASSGGDEPSGAPSSPEALTAAQIAQDRQAQSDLRNAVVAAKVMYTDSSTYAGADARGLGTIEPKLCYVSAATTSVANGAKCVSGKADASVSVRPSGQSWSAARLSESGTCFWISDGPNGTMYGSGLPCTGATAVGASTPDTFPGQAATATPPSANTEGCVDLARVMAASADARYHERLAARTPSLSLAIESALRAAGDWRIIAREFEAYPRIATGLRVGAARLEAATDALARGQNALGIRLFRSGAVSIGRSTTLIKHLEQASSC
jgi:hypothetical protein